MRRAVVRFQEAEGLYPTGVADQRTWLELLSPPYANVPTTAAHFIVTENVVNLRTGPSTDYPAVQRAQKDDTLDIAGKVSGSTPETTWYQLCCYGQEKVWARSERADQRADRDGGRSGAGSDSSPADTRARLGERRCFLCAARTSHAGESPQHDGRGQPNRLPHL